MKTSIELTDQTKGERKPRYQATNRARNGQKGCIHRSEFLGFSWKRKGGRLKGGREKRRVEVRGILGFQSSIRRGAGEERGEVMGEIKMGSTGGERKGLVLVVSLSSLCLSLSLSRSFCPAKFDAFLQTVISTCAYLDKVISRLREVTIAYEFRKRIAESKPLIQSTLIFVLSVHLPTRVFTLPYRCLLYTSPSPRD